MFSKHLILYFIILCIYVKCDVTVIDQEKTVKRIVYRFYGYGLRESDTLRDTCCHSSHVKGCQNCKIQVNAYYDSNTSFQMYSKNMYANEDYIDISHDFFFQEDNTKIPQLYFEVIILADGTPTLKDYTIPLSKFVEYTYKYENSYGIHGKIKFIAEIDINIYSDKEFSYLILKAKSINIPQESTMNPDRNRYKLWDSGNNEPPSLYYELDENVEHSSISQYIIIDISKIKDNVGTYHLFFNRGGMKIIERITLKDITMDPFEPKMMTVKTTHNDIINFTAVYACRNYYGSLCKQKCIPTQVYNYCLSNGTTRCQFTTNTFSSCYKDIYPQCNENSCNKNGICQMDGSSPKCICFSGYSGKSCESYYCKNKCSLNGKCIGPNKCKCNMFYIGEECDKFVCIEKSKDCINGQCYNDSNILKCLCYHKNIYGEYCENFHCNRQCYNGNCVLENYIPICKCFKNYDGPHCDKLNNSIYTEVRQKLKVFEFEESIAHWVIVILSIIISLHLVYQLRYMLVEYI